MPGLVTPEIEDIVREKYQASKARREQTQISAAVDEHCDCDCLKAGATVQKTGCYQQCEADYAKCTAPSADQIRQIYELTRPATSAEKAEHATMREELIEYPAREDRAYVREAFVKQFDAAPRILKQKILEEIASRYE